jgi:hypothetical protein
VRVPDAQDHITPAGDHSLSTFSLSSSDATVIDPPADRLVFSAAASQAGHASAAATFADESKLRLTASASRGVDLDAALSHGPDSAHPVTSDIAPIDGFLFRI